MKKSVFGLVLALTMTLTACAAPVANSLSETAEPKPGWTACDRFRSSVRLINKVDFNTSPFATLGNDLYQNAVSLYSFSRDVLAISPLVYSETDVFLRMYSNSQDMADNQVQLSEVINRYPSNSMNEWAGKVKRAGDVSEVAAILDDMGTYNSNHMDQLKEVLKYCIVQYSKDLNLSDLEFK